MEKTNIPDMTIKDLIEICKKMGADTDRVTIKIDNTENSNWICTFEMNPKEEEC